ncbi:MAG: glycosyltransferase family 4 protein, partial [Planctomycetaceae bacterium]|nr:glycosyltransferase family 4 protein [Planctomycetaceae bacterium]
MKVLAISATFPSVADPSRGVFVKERLRALAAIEGIDLRVLSPTPWFPPIKQFDKWYRWSQYPQQETFDGLLVDNPRYILPPKLGGYFHPQLMHRAIVKKVDRIRDEFPFDLIDAHYVYPAGSLAAMLGQRYGVPFVTTGRGEDMERFPDLPLVGNKIRWTLRHAAQCIGVSRQIADAMVQNGAQRTRTHVIPNGIDTSKFHPKLQEECRQLLDLPTDRKIILSVGDRLELKGFHLMAEAMPAVLKQNPDALYIIVGGPGRFGRDHTPQIQSLIDEHQLHDSVRIAGPQPHDRLIDWYNAADLYATLSSREGSPNVLLEALACGTPAIGTAVGGIQDELQNKDLGLLIPERSAEAIGKVANQALQRDWN